jgi:isoquinoline 1-oxidoreductase beta subunit
MQTSLSRRSFIVNAATLGGGLLLSIKTAGAITASKKEDHPWEDATHRDSTEFEPRLLIGGDDTITIRVTNAETGNGTLTQAAMSVAEELNCEWARIRTEFASKNRDYREGAYSPNAGIGPYFAGRSTKPELLKIYLQLGASARERLRAAAAAKWGVSLTEVETDTGILLHKPSGRRLRYGQIAAQASKIVLNAEPELKPRGAWRVLGNVAPGKMHAPKVVNGSLVYGLDVRLPGMVYAALRQSPVHGGRLKYVDRQAVMHMPGVRAVVTVDPAETKGSPVPAPVFGFGLGERQHEGAGDGWTVAKATPAASAAQHAVAVIADTYWQARRALEALPVVWEPGPGGEWNSIDQVYQTATAALDMPGERVLTDRGNISRLEQQGEFIEASYLTPYCDHCAMEPLNGTALVTAEKVELWHPTHDADHAFWVAVDETGVDPAKVFVNQTFIGGSFGRRVYGSDVRMVVAVARKFPNVPVQVIWSREETMRQGRYRAMVAAKFRAALDPEGLPEFMRARIAGHGISYSGLSDNPYANGAIPNIRIESQRVPLHLMTGPYRGPGYNSFAFIVDTFIDECAVAAKIDPLEYRLRLLAKWPDIGWTNCLKVAAEKAKWGQTLPKGRGQGIAISNFSMAGKPQAGTTVCTVATVSVTRSGVLSVEALDVAFDCGGVLNRNSVQTQVEGATLFGLNMSLNEELTISNGAVVEGNFDTYSVMRMSEVPPQINIHFDALSGHERFSIIGEAPVGPVGPAIGNAIFQATGKRIRSMPFRKSDLSWS